MKECCKFKIGKCASEINPQPLTNFAKDKKRKDGLTPHCKSCLKSYRESSKDMRRETIKKWRENHPEKMREYRRRSSAKNYLRMKKWREKNRLKSIYNISNEDWQKMFNDQEGYCLICNTHASKLKRGLCVDHDHSTNEVRGLLCHPCNKAIGIFKDNIDILENAKKYLSKGKT